MIEKEFYERLIKRLREDYGYRIETLRSLDQEKRRDIILRVNTVVSILYCHLLRCISESQ